jgi:hypothetical protein
MKLFKSCVLSTSHEYVVRVTTIFQCLSLIELNAWEDECFIIIKALQERKRKRKNQPKRRRRKKSDLICGQYTNVCKLNAK